VSINSHGCAMQEDLTGAVSIAKLKRVLDVSGTPPVLLRFSACLVVQQAVRLEYAGIAGRGCRPHLIADCHMMLCVVRNRNSS